MFKDKQFLLITFLIFIISFLSIFDLFVNAGRSANMDGLVHITTIAQFTEAFKRGDFPITWLDNFANYGMPIGIVAHQIPTYIGMIFNIFLNNPVQAFNLTCLIGIFLSNIFFYLFLNKYFSPLYSFLGTFILTFAPYRIINLYIRGAIPETISTIFLPLVFLGIYYLFNKKHTYAFFLLIFSFTGLVLTHPMMVVTYSFLFIPYFIFMFLTHVQLSLSFKKLFTKKTLIPPLLLGTSLVVTIGLSGYYVLPLTQEIKYFYYGFEKNHLAPHHFMGLKNYLDYNWYYFYKDDIFPRGHFIQAGLVETLSIIFGFFYIIYSRVVKRTRIKPTILEWSVATAFLVIFFTLEIANPIFQTISFLGNIQFPWRLFSSFIFVPPIILVFLLAKLNKTYLVVGMIVLIAVLRFPELYGKNYTNYPLSSYQFNPINLHSNNMNTIWTDRTDRYPIKRHKIELIGGEGTIVDKQMSNSWRRYSIDAKTSVQLVDYTFYFPGWHVYVDGIDTAIQFQDPNYRGVITYNVPEGKHEVVLRFEDTKIRLLGKIISGFFLVFTFSILILRKKIFSYISY